MNFNDPKEFDDPQLFNDPQQFDNPQLLKDKLEVWTLIIQKSTVMWYLHHWWSCCNKPSLYMEATLSFDCWSKLEICSDHISWKWCSTWNVIVHFMTFPIVHQMHLREGVNGKKNVFFRALPEWWGGVYPCPNFLALFLEVHFWSIKRVYFFKNANVLNF